MPNRWLRESARTSKNLGVVSDFAERLFWRLITTADDYGRFLACVSIVRATCFPLMDRLSLKKVELALAELAKHDLIDLYTVGDRRYGHFRKWKEYQGPPRASKSKYPEPPTMDSLQNQSVAAVSVNICKQMHTDVPGGPETETETDSLSSSSLNPKTDRSCNGQQHSFEIFWEHYPKHRGRGHAEKAWAKIQPDDVLLGVMLAKIDQAKKTTQWTKDRGEFIPHPATWLNAKGWEDDYTMPRMKPEMEL